MNPYELILIFNASLGEEKTSQVLSKIEAKIKSLGGEIEKTDKWGSKRLASAIKKVKGMTQGYYVLITFKSPSEVPAELRNFLKVMEEVPRYFISKAQVIPLANTAGKGIAGTPLAAIPVETIKGEPLGQPQ